MATSDYATVIRDKSDMFSDETGNDIVEDRVRTFGFDMKTEKTDLTLLVEDKKIYVTRIALEITSTVFEKIFSEQLLDGKQNEVRIQDKMYDAFVEFLACIYPGKMREVTSTNVHRILPLAYEYDVDFLKRRCESVLIKEMSKSSVNEGFIVKYTNADIPYNLFSVRHLGLDRIVQRRLEEIESSDKELPLDTEGKVYVYEKMLTSLRSEACRNRYLSAGRYCKIPMNLDIFTDAKYKRLDLRLDVKKEITALYEVIIWDRICKIDVQKPNCVVTIKVIPNSVKDGKLLRFPMASKVVVKNNDALCPVGDFCVQDCKVINENITYFDSNCLRILLRTENLQGMKYRMNGVYRVGVHILMNIPEDS